MAHESPGLDAMPALVPARMVNEVLYCERLMYLEWVQGEFADNAFTVEGRAAHRRADRGGGRLPERDAAAQADDDPERPVVARSVWLSDDDLGITAKIDLVETLAGRVLPVEYKRGTPPPVHEKAYVPERAQVCAQVLLLRACGYECGEGVIYYAAARRRVTIAIDEELIQTTRGAARRARELAAAGRLPPPLVGSPKCIHCSLAPLCLPDEVNELAEREAALGGQLDAAPAADRRVRRLHPARDDRLPLYVEEHRARVGLAGECLVVKLPDGDSQQVRIPNTSQVCIVGNAQVTTQALRRLLQRGIPVAFFTAGGWLAGRATGTTSNNIELRIAQHRAADDEHRCLDLARRLVESKIRNSRTMLRRNASHPDETALASLRQLARKARRIGSIGELLGIEGSAARAYYSQLPRMFKQSEALGTTFDFQGRNRRPPRDPVNAMLSFAYALLTKDLTLAAAAVGFDPLLGFYHQPRFGRPALALDLMEEFRPIVADSVVIAAVNNGVVQPGDFLLTPVGVALTSHARKRFIQAYERRMDQLVTHPVFGYRISYRRVLEVQARLLARTLLGELSHYPTFQTR